MSAELHDQIKELIERHGAMGVNAIQKEIGIPLSTLQRYLDTRQNYFKKTNDRKWDLPENVSANYAAAAETNQTQVIESQLTGITATFDMLSAQIKATVMLLETFKVKPQSSSVAGSSNGKPIEVKGSLADLHKLIQLTPKIIRTKIDYIPEEYRDLLKGMNWSDLAADVGKIRFTEFTDVIADMIVSDIQEVPTNMIEIMEQYQK